MTVESLLIIPSAKLWDQANEEKDKLLNLMKDVQAKLDKNKSSSSASARIDLSQCTWNQVMQEVQRMASQRSTSPKKSSKVARYISELGRNSDAFRSWLEILPGGDYGSRYASKGI
jgi:hypothetical protein